jgi:hypothetical protein
MSLGIREILDDEEFALVLDALDRERKRSLIQSKRTNGSRNANHAFTIQRHRDKAEMLEKTSSKLASNWD